MSLGDQSADEMQERLASLTIPLVEGGTLEFVALPGEISVFVGPNGSGKSALALFMERSMNPASRSERRSASRIVAHRKIWLPGSGPELLSSQRPQIEKNFFYHSSRDDSRWMGHTDSWSQLALHEAINRTTREVSQIADIARGRGPEGATLENLPDTTLDQLNRIVRQALPRIAFEIDGVGGLQVIPSNGGTPYPISEMSDGEKNALLVACDVLTQPTGFVLLIDEPERHMHRSISAPLFSALLAERSDCHFVLFTHDLDLADQVSSRDGLKGVILGCKWDGGGVPSAWEIHTVTEATRIPEDVRRAVLGGRKSILFVEGDEGSLDRSLFSLLYPEWFVSPVGGCTSVIRDVTGLNEAKQHHWLAAHGLVDEDRRSPEVVARLAGVGVTAIGVNEIENLYVSGPAIEALAQRQVDVSGGDADELAASARAAGLAALRDSRVQAHIAGGVALSGLRADLLDHLPEENSLSTAGNPITIEVTNPYQEEIETLKALVEADSYDELVRRYPIRDSSFRASVASALRFRNIDDMESAVRRWLAADEQGRAALRDLVGWSGES